MTQSDRPSSSTPRRGSARAWEPLCVAAFTVALLLPFIDRALHIDDPVFVRVAEQILDDPTHPYDFEYNWYWNPQSMWVVSQHPPLNSYVLAAPMRVWGDDERTLHIAYLTFAVGCSLLTYSLARRLCAHPLTVALLSAASPVFLVTACGVMADVPLLFFWLLAVRLAVLYADTSAPWALWGAALAASAALMTKYFGVALIPLLAVYCLPQRHRSAGHILALGLPIVVLLAWGVYSDAETGAFHPLGAAGTAVQQRTLHAMARNLAVTLTYLGAGLLWPVLMLPFFVRLPWKWLAVVVALGAYAAAVEGYTLLGVEESRTRQLLFLTEIAVAAWAGSAVLVVAMLAWIERPAADSTLLGLWLFGTVFFVAVVNWTVNARVLLPCAVPALLLVMRWVESRQWPSAIMWIRGAVVPTCVVSLLVGLADQEFANANRDFARETVQPYLARGERVWFTGHWGLQYYLEELGAQPLDQSNQLFRFGDLMIYPAFNANLDLESVPAEFRELETMVVKPNTYWFHTVSPFAQAGFYFSEVSSLPYNVGESRSAEFAIMRIVDPNRGF